jgi:hypothetical protein
MRAEGIGAVTRVAGWEHGGVLYYVHLGCASHIARHLTIQALGPERCYRSMVLRPEAVANVLAFIMGAADLAARTETVECLLALRGALLN